MMKNPRRARVRAETRTCGTDSAPIRLADQNHTHYPSRRTVLKKKDGSMTDFKHTQSDPHGSREKCQSAPWREVRQEYE